MFECLTRNTALVVGGAVLVLGLTAMGYGDDTDPYAVAGDAAPPTSATTQVQTEVRIYDITDLIAAHHEKSIPRDHALWIHPEARRLIDQIVQGVGDEDEWSINGGDISSIDVLNEMLVARTSPNNHREIRDILTRERMSLQPSIVFPDPPDPTLSGERRLYRARDLYVTPTWFIHPLHLDDREAQLGPPAEAELREAISRVITESVGDFNEWNINGGDISRIDEVPDGLLITTSPRNHYEIDKLLLNYRLWHNPPVRFQVTCLLIPVGGPVPGDLAPELERIDDGHGRSVGYAFLSADEAEALLLKADSITDAATITLPELVLWHGQKAYTSVTSQSDFIAGYRHNDPFNEGEGLGGENTYLPITRFIEQGVIFSAHITIGEDRQYAKATLRPTFLNLARPIPKQPWGDAPDGVALVVDKPDIAVLDVELALSIPDESTLLIDMGRTRGPVEKADLADAAAVSLERRVLILVSTKMTAAPPVGGAGGHGGR